jgi:hypothetical protein
MEQKLISAETRNLGSRKDVGFGGCSDAKKSYIGNRNN